MEYGMTRWTLTVFRYNRDKDSKETLFEKTSEFLSPLLMFGESVIDDSRGIYYECRLIEKGEGK